MTSTFTFISNKWQSLHPAMRFSISIYLIARVALSGWALLVGALYPLSVSNLNLHGEPIVTVFNLGTNARATFSRVLDGRELHFRSGSPNITDLETDTVWNLGGRAISGRLSGRALFASIYSAEDVFPYHGVEASRNIFFSAWQRFDANWYLKIARSGYVDAGSMVYFPLYPLFIRILGTLLVNRDLVAAMIISNLSLVGVFYLIYQIAIDLIGDKNSKRTIVFFVIFPTAFFLFAPYTESLFLFFTLASFYMGIRTRWMGAGILGALAALTRLQGVLIFVPLIYLAWKDFHKRESRLAAKSPLEFFTFYFSRFAPLLFIPFSTLAFLAFTNLSILDTYQSQLYARFVSPWDNLAAAYQLIANSRASLVDALNLFFAGLFGIMVMFAWLKLPREFGLYSLAMYLAPLFRMTTEQPLVSMARYVLVIFPVFILWGIWGQNAWLNRAIVYPSLLLQLFLSAQFVQWGWVG